MKTKIDLSCVINWLANGCDVAEAVKELKSYEEPLKATYAELKELRAQKEESLQSMVFASQAINRARAELEELREYKQRVTEAAEAVIERWDSPLWKWDEHTGKLIHKLRDAVRGDENVD